MDSYLTYRELIEDINQQTLRLMEEYKINEVIRIEGMEEEKMTQEIFLRLLDEHIEKLLNVIQSADDEENTVKEFNILEEKKKTIQRLYQEFSKYNKELYVGIVKNKNNEKSHNNKSGISRGNKDMKQFTPQKDSVLQRKNCKIGLSSFENNSNSNSNSNKKKGHQHDYYDNDDNNNNNHHSFNPCCHHHYSMVNNTQSSLHKKSYTNVAYNRTSQDNQENSIWTALNNYNLKESTIRIVLLLIIISIILNVYFIFIKK